MPLIKENIKRSFLFNLAIVLALFTLVYVGFFASLHWFTKHGQEVIIPDVRGKAMADAVATLKTMHFDVAVDSTYEPAAKPLAVLKQVPDTGSRVKEGRTVFLTVNMLTPPRIPMPNLINLSYRSAEMLLRNNKLIVGDTSSRPDIAAGAVLEQTYKGTAVRPGELIPQGSKIGMVIGNGLGNTEWNMPDVSGITVDEARTILNQYNLEIIFSLKDEMTKITDTPSAIVIDQTPREFDGTGGRSRIKMGQIIDLIIAQNPEDADMKQIEDNRAQNKSTLPGVMSTEKDGDPVPRKSK